MRFITTRTEQVKAAREINEEALTNEICNEMNPLTIEQVNELNLADIRHQLVMLNTTMANMCDYLGTIANILYTTKGGK